MNNLTRDELRIISVELSGAIRVLETALASSWAIGDLEAEKVFVRNIDERRAIQLKIDAAIAEDMR